MRRDIRTKATACMPIAASMTVPSRLISPSSRMPCTGTSVRSQRGSAEPSRSRTGDQCDSGARRGSE